MENDLQLKASYGSLLPCTSGVSLCCEVAWICRWCDSFMCAMTHLNVWHDAFIRLTWLIHMCGVTHSYVWHDSCICVPWLIHICGVTHSHIRRDAFMCSMIHLYVPWPIHMCHDSFTCVATLSYVPWLIHTCHDISVRVMTHPCVPWVIHVCHDSFMGAMPYSDVCHDALYNCYRAAEYSPCSESRGNIVTRLNHTCHDSVMCAMPQAYVPCLIHMFDMTHSYVWHDSFTCVMTHCTVAIDPCHTGRVANVEGN